MNECLVSEVNKMDLPYSDSYPLLLRLRYWFGLEAITSSVLFAICFSMVLTMWLYRLLSSPVRYKLDMTTKEYCKSLGETNNWFKNKNLKMPNSISDRQVKNNNNRTLLDESPLIEEDIKHVNGWIPVKESSKVGPGEVKRSTVFGKDLIITRSEDGKQINILDAYCPHGGAHIGVGGSVKSINNESCVQCPFHGWTFRASDGECVDIPYQKKKCIPIQARISSYTCCEVDDFIYLWHDMNGNPPNWWMLPTPQLVNKDWVQTGRSCHISNLELEYMQENGADLNHFAGIHEDLVFLGNVDNLPGNKYLRRYIKHCWQPEWNPIKDQFGRQTHMAQLTLKSYLTIFGLKVFEFNLVATQIGPARVKLFYDSKWVGRGMLSMNSVPISGRRVKYIQHVYSEPSLLSRLQARIVLYGEIKMIDISIAKKLERDLMIWNHKKFLKNPVLVPEDKVQRKFKLWYSQFYRRKIRIGIDNNLSEKCDAFSIDHNNSQPMNYISGLES